MAQIEILSPAQRTALDWVRDTSINKIFSPNKRAMKSTMAVLLRDGFVSYDADENRWVLTETGHALYEEDALRAQTVAAFTLSNPTLDLCAWHGGNGKPYTVEWVPVTLITIFKTRLKLQFADGSTTIREPRRVRQRPAAISPDGTDETATCASTQMSLNL